MNFTQFTDRLNKYNADKIVFVGLGNEARADDIAGLLFIQNLSKTKRFKKSKFIEAGSNPENYLEKILNCNPRVIVFVDAAEWGGNYGESKWLDSREINSISFSTHAFSLKMLEDFFNAHKQVECLYLGIQPCTTEFGEEISSQVKERLWDFFESAKKEFQ